MFAKHYQLNFTLKNSQKHYENSILTFWMINQAKLQCYPACYWCPRIYDPCHQLSLWENQCPIASLHLLEAVNSLNLLKSIATLFKLFLFLRIPFTTSLFWLWYPLQLWLVLLLPALFSITKGSLQFLFIARPLPLLSS